MTKPLSTSTLDLDEEYLREFEFKGITIQPLSYARRACILGLVNLSDPEFIDLPTFIYGCLCPERELIRARRKPETFDAAVFAWINQVKYTIQDADEAASLIASILTHSESGRAVPNTDPMKETGGDFESDPN